MLKFSRRKIIANSELLFFDEVDSRKKTNILVVPKQCWLVCPQFGHSVDIECQTHSSDDSVLLLATHGDKVRLTPLCKVQSLFENTSIPFTEDKNKTKIMYDIQD